MNGEAGSRASGARPGPTPTELGVHPSLAAAFAALDRRGITWSLVRGADDLVRPRGDVDVLVSRADADRVDPVATSAGFVRVPAAGHGSHRFYVAYDEDGDLWLKLDVVTELTYGPNHALATSAEAGCLARRQRVGLVWTLAPDDAFWALLLHCLLDREDVPPRHEAALGELLPHARPDGPLGGFVGRLCPPGWGSQRFLDTAAARDWTMLLGLAPALSRRWRERDRTGYRLRTITNEGARRTTKLWKLARRDGRLVALLGPDGTGKSTLAEAIATSFFHPTRTVYLGLYAQQAESSRAQHAAVRIARRVVWLASASAAIHYHRAAGRLVVSDRHSVEALLGERAEPGRFARLRRRVLARALPAPDLALVLDAPADVLHARRDEHSPEELEAQRALYAQLAQKLDYAERVDATDARDSLRRRVIALIWALYRENATSRAQPKRRRRR